MNNELWAEKMIRQPHLLPELRIAGEKIINKERLSEEDGLILFEKAGLCTAISPILTAIFILNPPMYVFSVVSFVLTAAYMPIAKKGGS